MTTRDGTSISSAPASDAKAQITWLRAELESQLKRYQHRRRRDKRKAFALQIATVVLSATITVLLGLRVTGHTQQVLSDVALVLGAVITVFAAAEAFFGHRNLWLLRTSTVRKLEALVRRLDFYEAGLGGSSPQSSEVNDYQSELDAILEGDFNAWQRLRQTSTRNEDHKS